MKRFLQLAAATATLLASAQATEIVFTDLNVSGQTVTVNAGGQSVDMTAATWTEDSYDAVNRTGTGTIDLYGPTFDDWGTGLSDSAYLVANRHGLQMYSNYAADNHQIDGLLGRDIVVFEFDDIVTLTDIAFNSHYVANWDDFVVFAGNSLAELSAFSMLDVANPSVALNVTGMVFGIGAFDWNDAFKITALTFDETNPVPLPGAAVLMLTGLAVTHRARRRRA